MKKADKSANNTGWYVAILYSVWGVGLALIIIASFLD